MKNFILIGLLLFAPISVMAQYPDWEQFSSDIKEKPSWNEVKGSYLLYGGYNFLEKTPITGVQLCCNIGYLKGDIELGWSYILKQQAKNHFYYVAFSAGPQIGNKTKYYALLGVITWSGFLKNNFYSDIWRARLKIGSDVFLSKKVYLNVGIGYIFPCRNVSYEYSKLLSTQIGLGFRF